MSCMKAMDQMTRPDPSPDRVLLHFWSAGSLLQRRTLFAFALFVYFSFFSFFVFLCLFSAFFPAAAQEFYLLANISQTCSLAAAGKEEQELHQSVGTKSLTGKNQS